MDSTELVKKIERRDRAWRGLIGVVVALMLAALTILIILVLQADNRLEIAIQTINENARSNHEQIDSQLQALQDQHRQQDQYILCLAELFSNKKPDATCIPPFPGSGGSAQQVTGAAQSNQQAAQAQPATPPAKTAPAPSPVPTPSPKTTPFGQVLKALRTITGGLL